MSALAEQVKATVAEAQAPPQMTDRDRNNLFMDQITDETLRRRADQIRLDNIEAQLRSQALGVAAPLIALKYMYGRDYGFNEAQSLQFIHLIPQGQIMQPSLDYKGRALLLRRAGYDWKVVEHTSKSCEYQFYYMGKVMTTFDDKPLRMKYTFQDAMDAGLVQKARGKESKADAKGTYDLFGADMLFSRMLTRFHKFHAAEVAGGAAADPSDRFIEDVVEETESRMAAASRAQELMEQLKAVKAEQPEAVTA